MLERELRTRSRKRGSRFFDVGANDNTGTLRQSPVTFVSTSASVAEEQSKPPAITRHRSALHLSLSSLRLRMSMAVAMAMSRKGFNAL